MENTPKKIFFALTREKYMKIPLKNFFRADARRFVLVGAVTQPSIGPKTGVV